jgi:hypothetical protein
MGRLGPQRRIWSAETEKVAGESVKNVADPVRGYWPNGERPLTVLQAAIYGNWCTFLEREFGLLWLRCDRLAVSPPLYHTSWLLMARPVDAIRLWGCGPFRRSDVIDG